MPTDDSQAAKPGNGPDLRIALGLCCTVAAAFAVRAWALAERGVLAYDETYYYILGRNLFAGEGYSLNGLPHTAFPPLYPILVGFAALFFDNARFATSIVSALASAALPLPVYFLARDVFGRRVAALSAVLTAVWPALFFFAARSVTYRERLYAGSEPLFLTLVTTAIFFACRAARAQRLWAAGLSGVFFGLAALTRNETTVLMVFAGAWLVVQVALIDRVVLKKVTALAAVVAACFAVTVAPYILYVHSISGRWSFGAKLSNLATTRPTLWEWIIEDNSYAYVRVHNALNEDASELEDDYWGVTPYHREERGAPSSLRTALRLVRHPDFAWLGPFAASLVDGFVPLVPWYWWIFMLAGAAAAFNRPGGLKYCALLATLVAALAFMAVTMYSIARFQLPVVPLAVVLAAAGLDRVAALVSRIAAGIAGRAGAAGAAYVGAVAIVAAAMAVSGVQANLRGGRDISVVGAYSSNDSDLYAAEVLREKLPPGSTLMCNEPWIAVYAGLEWRTSPVAEPDRIVTYALKKGIDYALLGSWQTGRPPEQSPLQPYLLTVIDTPKRKLYVYDFKNAVDDEGEPAATGETGA